MFIYVDETLQLGLDCVAGLGAGRRIAYGWTMTPRAAATTLAISAGAEGDCPIEHCSFHARPDVPPPDPRTTVVHGFTLVFSTPQDPRELTLTLLADEAVLRADLRDPQIEINLFKATAERDGHATFTLLRDCAGRPDLAGVLGYHHRPYGAFAEWLGRLPAVRGRAEQLGPLAEVEALASPSGEVMVTLRSALPVPAEAGLRAALIGYLDRPADGTPDNAAGETPEIAVLPLLDWHAAPLGGALAGYARFDPARLERLQALEVVLEVELRPAERFWLRVQPRPAAVPDFLDAAGRLGAAAPGQAGASAALALLRQVIRRREAAFAPTLADMAAGAAGAGAADTGPRLALILGADDPTAARLFHVTAAEFERRCDRLLVMGEAADDVAQAFARRGRVAVTVGTEAALALRDAAGQAGILAIDAARYAEAIAAGRPEEPLARPLAPTELARLLTLHAVAGCGPSLSDSLARLLRLRDAEPGTSAFAPVPRAWSSIHAADLVNDHLARLWMVGQAPAARRPEGAAHG